MKLEELGRVIREKDPAAVLVPSAVLERVIQNVTNTTWILWQVPHRRCFLVDRFTLFRHVEQEELYLPADHLLPETVLLLEKPTNDQLAASSEEVLSTYWRLLFHITIHRELEQKLRPLPLSALRERIEALGPAAFEEARNVLTQDSMLVDRADDLDTYVEFAAQYLELRLFAKNLVPVYFPSLPPEAEVDRLLARDIDAKAIFDQTRLPAAPDPVPKTDDQADESHDYFFRLERTAQRTAMSQDMVGAAITFTRAARVAPVYYAGRAQDAARDQIVHLIARLKSALDLTDDEVVKWTKVLPSLLDKADQGTRPVEAALLFDLQRACMDHEQTIYTLDVFEWLLSAGYRPIRRPLDGQRYVRVPAHLRNAIRRLTAARLSDNDRQALGSLLREALNRSEDRLRQRFRPVLTDALHDAGMRPSSPPEEVAVAKTVEELLDRISASGFLAFADVRDAIARGQMKLPDLSGPHEYLRGDPLLRLDRRLSTLLDGLYRRSEIYVRWLERVTSFNFGTETGRWITRNVTLPFLGAFLLAQFAWLFVYERQMAHTPERRSQELEAASVVLGGESTDEATTLAPSFFGGWNALWTFHLAWFALGLIFLLLIRSARARAIVREVGQVSFRIARAVLVDLPLRLWRHRWVKELLSSGPLQLFLNYVVKPIALAGLAWLTIPGLWESGMAARLLSVIVSGFFVNSRIGRSVEALLLQAATWVLRIVRSAPALIRWINDFFRLYIDAVEWLLSRADDWLRLRGTDGTVSVVIRAIAGVLWAPFAFILRFYVVVLIEPMINPLKLPLSILFAKFVYPLLIVMGLLRVDKESWVGFSSGLVEDLAPYLTQPIAWFLVIGTFYLLPDAVTFLFWEMRENWRLYRANRPVSLKPVSVGPSGESIRGLLHYGIHSGTIPRLFARLRSSERVAVETGIWRDVRTHRQALSSVEEAVRRFAIRDLCAVVKPSPGWGGRKITARRILLGTNRIRIELCLEGSPHSAWLEFEDRSGWIVAGWAEAGWVIELPAEPARVLANALAYLYKRAGVDVIREQVRAALPKEASHFDVVSAGLLVWYGHRESTPVLYDLAHRADDLRPRSPDNLAPTHGPTLDADRLLFSRVKLTWPQWVEVWQADREGRTGHRFGPAEFHLSLLPPGTGEIPTTRTPAPAAEANGNHHSGAEDETVRITPRKE